MSDSDIKMDIESLSLTTHQQIDKISLARHEYMRYFQNNRTKYEIALLNGRKTDSHIPLKVNRNK